MCLKRYFEVAGIPTIMATDTTWRDGHRSAFEQVLRANDPAGTLVGTLHSTRLNGLVDVRLQDRESERAAFARVRNHNKKGSRQ